MRLRVLTYNIHRAIGVDRRFRPDRIVKILAHHGRLLFAQGQMELGQEAAKSVDPLLKDLASIRAAMLVGCPF